MTDIKINAFNIEVHCVYKENKYSVRDNGAVLRHPKDGKKPRPLDNKWTFGKPCKQKGYLMFASEFPIHRIVATAFHGEPPTKEHVVDHIDTNRRNNRSENLRWLTRLENILLNPITVKRIILACGSLEKFLNNPRVLDKCNFDPNFGWMRAVSPLEAKACKERLLYWAQSKADYCGGSLGEWVFSLPRNLEAEDTANLLKHEAINQTNMNNSELMPFKKHVAFKAPPKEQIVTGYDNYRDSLVVSKTPKAAQRKWQTPSEFPHCPQDNVLDPIKAYAINLVPGVIFSQNLYSTSQVLESALADSNQTIIVMCQKDESGAIKPFTLAKVTYEEGLYIHESLGSFFEEEGVKKYFCLAQGLTWEGGDTFDDFC